MNEREQRIPMNAVRLGLSCAQCQIGEMMVTDVDTRLHECNNCGAVEHLTVVYPVITFEEVRQ